MKRTHLNTGLLVVAVGLAVAVWVSQKKEEKLPPLTSLVPADVTTISIEHPGSPAIRLSKTKNSWSLVEPVKVEADPFEVNALVGLADTATQSELKDAGLDLKPLGLDPAAYKVTLNDQVVEFGGEEPIKYHRYVRVDGRKVALINDPPGTALDKDYSDLVARNLIPGGADITHIAVPGVTLDKTAGGTWSSSDQPQAKPEQLQALVDAWKGAKSLYNSALPANADKGEPADITLADGRTLKFVIISRTPQFVITSPELGVAYTVGKNEADAMLKLAAPAAAAPAPVTEGSTPGADPALPTSDQPPQSTSTPPPESSSP